MHFMHTTLRTVEEYGQLTNSIPSDALALHGLLLALLKLPSAIHGMVGLLMRLRDSCPEGARGQVLQTILIRTLQQLAVTAECAPFGDLLIRAETLAREEQQWTDNFEYQAGISFKRLPGRFEDLRPHGEGPVTCLPPREDMLEMLAQHTKFGSDLRRDLIVPSVAVTTSGRSPRSL